MRRLTVTVLPLVTTLALGLGLGACGGSSDAATPKAKPKVSAQECATERSAVETAAEAYRVRYGSYPTAVSNLLDGDFLLHPTPHHTILNDGDAEPTGTVIGTGGCS